MMRRTQTGTTATITSDPSTSHSPPALADEYHDAPRSASVLGVFVLVSSDAAILPTLLSSALRTHSLVLIRINPETIRRQHTQRLEEHGTPVHSRKARPRYAVGQALASDVGCIAQGRSHFGTYPSNRSSTWHPSGENTRNQASYAFLIPSDRKGTTPQLT